MQPGSAFEYCLQLEMGITDISREHLHLRVKKGDIQAVALENKCELDTKNQTLRTRKEPCLWKLARPNWKKSLKVSFSPQ